MRVLKFTNYQTTDERGKARHSVVAVLDNGRSVTAPQIAPFTGTTESLSSIITACPELFTVCDDNGSRTLTGTL